MAYTISEPKDSNATLDYKFDFRALTNSGGSNVGLSDWLESDEIIDSYDLTVNAVTSGCLINIVDSYLSNSNSSVVVFVSGGDIYKEYYITCKITTSSSPVSRIDERTIKIKIMDR